MAAIGVFWIALIAAGLGLTSCTPEVPKGCGEVAREPNISPDYSGTTIPPNIAPLNFRVLEPGRNYVVKVHARARGQAVICYISIDLVLLWASALKG